MAVQKYDIRRPKSEGGGFEERYWSPLNCPVLGDEGKLSYIIHRVEDVTDLIRLNQQKSEQNQLTEELRIRADEMEAEINLRTLELQEANKEPGKARDELERRVLERTAELEAVADLLRVSEERYRLLFESNPHPMWVYDIESLSFIAVNDAAVAHYGYSPAEFAEMTIADIREPEEVPIVLEAVRTLSPDTATKVIRRHRKKDGTLIDIEGTSRELTIRGRRARLVLATDITERKRAEEELRASEAKLQTIVENLSEGLVVSDLAGNLLHFNRAALDIHGFSDPEEGRRHLTDADIFELADLEDNVLSIDQWPLARILRGESLHDRQIRIRRLNADWQRVISYGGMLVHDSAGNPMMAIVTIDDITDHKRREEEVRQLNAELEQRVVRRTAELEAANRELEAFSYSVSHDLRAPLRAVDGFSQAVLEDYGPQLPEEGRRYLNTIRQSAQRMGELIDDLLTFSRLSRQQLNTRKVDTGNLVRNVLQELNRQLEGRQVDVRIQDLPFCRADPALLKQVWINLLSNALKFTSRRGDAVVEIGCDQKSDQNVFFVRDNGTGFDMQYSDKLFGVFQRLHRAEDFEGTGVGLAIVQRVINRHGGRVWAEGSPDRGATFYFTLEENHA